MIFNLDTIKAMAARCYAWTNQWHDPEVGPFEGDETEYLIALADTMLETAVMSVDREEAIREVMEALVEIWPTIMTSKTGSGLQWGQLVATVAVEAMLGGEKL